MENMIFNELEKQKNHLRDLYKNKFTNRLSDSEIDEILKSIDSCINGMIKLMREGKSAHEKFFSDIILNSNDAIIGRNKDSQVFLWNKGAEKLFGYKKEEVLGKTPYLIVPDYLQKRGEMDFLHKELAKTGYVNNYETIRIAKDGSKKNVSISSFSVAFDNNEQIGLVFILRDISNEKKLEQELRERENLALIGEVVSSIAHNLSNPLNIISGNADYLLIDKKENESGYEELKVILEETTRITKSIRQILNFSKPVTLTREIADINDILEDVVNKSKFMIGNKKISIKKKFDKILPVIKIDIELIRDVLLNIISNSIQAIPINGTVNIKSYSEEKFVIVEISDNGLGIAPEHIHKIFKPFFSTKGYGKGTGLGLSFADRVVKEHHGKIKVTSVLDKGTTFKIYLPAE